MDLEEIHFLYSLTAESWVRWRGNTAVLNHTIIESLGLEKNSKITNCNHHPITTMLLSGHKYEGTHTKVTVAGIWRKDGVWTSSQTSRRCCADQKECEYSQRCPKNRQRAEEKSPRPHTGRCRLRLGKPPHSGLSFLQDCWDFSVPGAVEKHRGTPRRVPTSNPNAPPS